MEYSADTSAVPADYIQAAALAADTSAAESAEPELSCKIQS
jgi:hypothetical protein